MLKLLFGLMLILTSVAVSPILIGVVFMVVVGSVIVVFALVRTRPTAVTSTAIDEFGSQVTRAQHSPKGRLEKIGDVLEDISISEVEETDDVALVSTDSAGDFVVDHRTDFTSITKINHLRNRGDGTPLNVRPFPASVGLLEIIGAISSGSLVLGEPLTGATSSAVAKIVFSDDLTVGAARTVYARLISGTPDPGGEQWDGVSGEIIGLTDPPINKQFLTGHISVASTGADHATQSNVPVDYALDGVPVSV